MNKYYILSLKHTNKDDVWLTFWRPEERGYCWFKDWAGMYELLNPNPLVFERDSCVYVSENLLADMWTPVYYEEEIRLVVFNNFLNRQKLLIHKSQLLASWPTPLGHYDLINEEFVKTLELKKIALQGYTEILKNKIAKENGK